MSDLSLIQHCRCQSSGCRYCQYDPKNKFSFITRRRRFIRGILICLCHCLMCHCLIRTILSTILSFILTLFLFVRIRLLFFTFFARRGNDLRLDMRGVMAARAHHLAILCRRSFFCDDPVSPVMAERRDDLRFDLLRKSGVPEHRIIGDQSVLLAGSFPGHFKHSRHLLGLCIRGRACERPGCRH